MYRPELLPVAIGIMLFGGCDRPSPPAYPTASLAGKVTVDGRPIELGKVVFMPLESGRGGGVVANVLNGRYEAQWVPCGRVNVTFNAVRETGKMVKSLSSSKPQPERIDLIPAKYRVGIPLEVTDNNPQQDFVL